MRHRVAIAERQPLTVRLAHIPIRDPYLLAVEQENAYYLFGSTDPDVWNAPGVGFDCYRSTDLAEWEGPIPAFRPPEAFWADRNFWAPEVHAYAGRYFMFASFAGTGRCRGTQVLAADRPEGPFTVWSDGPVTPPEWECLDGTLHIDRDGDPWLVFCHEWTQVVDGEVVAQRLSRDLRATIGDPLVQFRASEAPWTRVARHPLVPPDVAAYVTDGPFLHRLTSGELIMLWSSFGDDGYAMGIARSVSGEALGPWEHQSTPLWAADGGHGMIARTLEGELVLVLHQPNETPLERAVFHRLVETPQGVRLSAPD